MRGVLDVKKCILCDREVPRDELSGAPPSCSACRGEPAREVKPEIPPFIWVSMAWNDDAGNFYPELFSIEIEDEITLETPPFEGVDVELFNQGGNKRRFVLHGESFHARDFRSWVGSSTWDQVYLRREEALKLMKIAGLAGFTCFEFAVGSPFHKAFLEGEKEHEQARERTSGAREDRDQN